jgi:RND family efflux transporter MFP subunit
MKRTVIINLAILLACAGAAWLFLALKPLSSDRESADSGKPFVATAESRDIEFSITVSGDVTPATQLEVKSEVGGKLIEIHVQPGQTVRKGDRLADIDDRDLLTEKASATTEIEGAQLQVDKTRKNFERSAELHEAKLISREVYDNLASDLALAENSLLKSERRLQVVEDKLRKTRLFAPTDGTVLSVDVLEGQVVIPAASVNSGTTMMTIADLSSLLVDTHVNQVDVTKIRIDQHVNLTGETVKDADVTAQISFIAPVATVKNNVKGFAVKAVIENPDPRLRPGMTVLMNVPVAHASHAVSVPISAVFRDGSKNVVYVVNGGSTEARPVDVGVSNLEYTEIRSGLEVGETILLVQPGGKRSRS